MRPYHLPGSGSLRILFLSLLRPHPIALCLYLHAPLSSPYASSSAFLALNPALHAPVPLLLFKPSFSSYSKACFSNVSLSSGAGSVGGSLGWFTGSSHHLVMSAPPSNL